MINNDISEWKKKTHIDYIYTDEELEYLKIHPEIPCKFTRAELEHITDKSYDDEPIGVTFTAEGLIALINLN